jgi:polar amino acid transport system substrate-binding protein
MRVRFYRFAAAALVALASLCFASQSLAATLHVGSDISYAPLEFYSHNQRVLGFDIDLISAIAQRLGANVLIQNHNFDDLLHAVQTGRYDLAISAISDTRPREGTVDFIDYLLAGSGILVQSGNPKGIFSLAALCGLRANVQKGSSQEGALELASKNCKAVGLGEIKIATFATNDEAFANFADGKADALTTDFPVVAYLARFGRPGQHYDVGGKQFDVVPFGIAVAKPNRVLRTAVQRALLSLIADGAYDALVRKWNLGQGALHSAPINAGTLF